MAQARSALEQVLSGRQVLAVRNARCAADSCFAGRFVQWLGFLSSA